MRVHLAHALRISSSEKGAQRAAAEEEKIREPAKDAFLNIKRHCYALLRTHLYDTHVRCNERIPCCRSDGKRLKKKKRKKTELSETVVYTEKKTKVTKTKTQKLRGVEESKYCVCVSVMNRTHRETRGRDPGFGCRKNGNRTITIEQVS